MSNSTCCIKPVTSSAELGRCSQALRPWVAVQIAAQACALWNRLHGMKISMLDCFLTGHMGLSVNFDLHCPAVCTPVYYQHVRHTG